LHQGSQNLWRPAINVHIAHELPDFTRPGAAPGPYAVMAFARSMNTALRTW
jgi:hypothetical protein